MADFKKSRFSFVLWGVRIYNSIFFLGYPVLGSFFALPEFSRTNLLKIFLFAFFNILFLTQVFLFNDWGDAHLNPEEPTFRDTQALKHPEIISPNQVLIICMVLGIISLFGIFYLAPYSGVLSVLVALVNIFYSHPFFRVKKHFALPELAHLSFGTLYFLSGWRLFKPVNQEAVLLAFFFGTILTAGNFANQIEHFEEELKSGLRTSAIIFGKRPAYHFSLWLFFLSAFYLLVLSIFKLAPEWLALPAILLLMVWTLTTAYLGKKNILQNIAKFRRAIRIIYAGFSFMLLMGIIFEKF